MFIYIYLGVRKEDISNNRVNIVIISLLILKPKV